MHHKQIALVDAKLAQLAGEIEPRHDRRIASTRDRIVLPDRTGWRSSDRHLLSQFAAHLRDELRTPAQCGKRAWSQTAIDQHMV
jgi:hypothetical protein